MKRGRTWADLQFELLVEGRLVEGRNRASRELVYKGSLQESREKIRPIM